MDTGQKLEIELAQQGYKERERWTTRQMPEFIRRELQDFRWPLLIGCVFLLVLLIYLLYAILLLIPAKASWITGALLPLLAGLPAAVLLIVPHELIHGFVFKLLGAPSVIYGAHPRQLIFYAAAPFFPLGSTRVLLAALAPFITITLTLMALLSVVNGWFWWLVYGALLVHTQGCLGDFAIVNFFFRQPDRSAWLCYDDPTSDSFILLCRSQSPAGKRIAG